MHFPRLPLSLLIYIAGALSTPVLNRDAGPSVPREHYSKYERSFQTRATHTFDPTYPAQELQAILIKYFPAENYLQGVDINPGWNISAFSNDEVQFGSIQTSLGIHAIDSSIPVINAAPVANTAQQPLTDDINSGLDVEYYGPLAFGSNAQSLTVDIDTGSADLWIPVQGCKNCQNGVYNPKTSTSYRNTGKSFSVTYGSGRVQGTLIQDTVSVGSGTNKLTATGQYLGAVNQETSSFQDVPSAGLIGAAFGSIASSKKPPFFETLITERKVAAPLFSVYLTRQQSQGSEVCWGCYDSSKAMPMAQITWIPVTSKTYWAVSMTSLSVNDGTVPTTLTAAIDTGTTLIYVPKNVADSFYALIPGAGPADGYGSGFYSYPCNSDLTISLSFNNNPFQLSMQDFNLGTTDDSNLCIGGILSSGEELGNFAIVGDEFLKSWYSTYDYSHGARVGFSASINGF